MIYFIILLSLGSCEEYISLFPISYRGDANHKIMDYDLFLMGNDTIKVSAEITGFEGDSTLYVFIELKLKKTDKRWENELSYYLVDKKGYLVKPRSIGKLEKDFGYIINFYTGEDIKLPIKFYMTDLNNDNHEVTFSLKKIE